ncbi:interleukin-20 receptor subunit alpha-like [Pseudophryne corroboree]|uniref:interleukin-20 receptor subunit alpha-like n=1 Tax=Pseudophryne corroboree TaxID=495146 RepID=UPI00308159DB
MRIPLLLLLLLLPQSEPGIQPLQTSTLNPFTTKFNCAPRNVTFSSSNKKNKLSWLPPETSEDIRYIVEYCECSSGSLHCKTKLECTNITETLCDLTNETSNSAKTFYGRVNVTSQVCSPRSKQKQLVNRLGGSKCAPRNVMFTSKNLKTNLTWLPPIKSEGIRYTVEYLEYGEKCWQKKLECTNITETFCDLTNETSVSEKQYYGRVTATSQVCSRSNRTQRFDPSDETELGPLTVHLFLTDTSIEINLTHPITFLHPIFKPVTYHIYKNNKKFVETEVPYYKIEHLDSHTTYCITAKVSVSGKRESYPSNEKCITTKADQRSIEIVKVIVGILSVVLFACMLFAAGYGVHKYIHVSNLRQPHILNITASSNNNTVLVEGHTVTINLITIGSGIKNVQKDMSGEEQIQTKSETYLTDGGDNISHDSGVLEDDHGYVSLSEPVPDDRPCRPQLSPSPYDMPHYFVREQARPVSAPLDPVLGEQDLYGQIKCKSDTAPLQEKDDLKVIQNMSDRTLSAYLPKNDNCTKLDSLNDDHFEEECLIDHTWENANVINDTGLCESGTLFLDWSPKNPHLRIPNLCNHVQEEFSTKQCLEAKEGLLSQLCIPPQPEAPPENDELVQLTERWELSIQMED